MQSNSKIVLPLYKKHLKTKKTNHCKLYGGVKSETHSRVQQYPDNR